MQTMGLFEGIFEKSSSRAYNGIWSVFGRLIASTSSCVRTSRMVNLSRFCMTGEGDISKGIVLRSKKFI
jgi:hypothetical protein